MTAPDRVGSDPAIFDHAPVLTGDQLADVATRWPIVNHAELAVGRIFSMVSDQVMTPSGDRMSREHIKHPGAVAVIAVDDDDRVVLVRQYRHPVGFRLLEPPAGLLDVTGEDWLVAAQRELAEEVALAADDWRVLVDYFTSPGTGSEAVRIFLARDLSPALRPDGFVLAGEEAEMETCLASLDDLAVAILAGRLGNPSLCVGVLAAVVARTGGYASLRPADASWPARD